MSHRFLLNLSKQKSVIPTPDRIPSQCPFWGRLPEGAQEETQPSFRPPPSLSIHSQPAAPSYKLPVVPGVCFPQAPNTSGAPTLTWATAIASGLSPSSPSSKLDRSKMSLVCLTPHAPHGPQKAQPRYHDFQPPNFLLCPSLYKSNHIRLHHPPNTLCCCILL